MDVLATMDESSVDAVVTDPPYGLSPDGKARTWDDVTDGRQRGGFMGKAWDAAVPGVTWARAVLRVLKPGGHLLAFGGTRTIHRLTCALEDGGFEIRDQLAWLHRQGWPKSAAVLKPALELIILARKPPIGTIAENVQTYGTGGLNIDACRIGDTKRVPGGLSKTSGRIYGNGAGVPLGDGSGSGTDPNVGRWPANVVLSHCPPDEHGNGGCVLQGTQRVQGQNPSYVNNDTSPIGYRKGGGTAARKNIGYADPDGLETVDVWQCIPDCAVKLLDEQAGELTSGVGAIKRMTGRGHKGSALGTESRPAGMAMTAIGDTGSASRFFYCAKASSAERYDGTGVGVVHPTVKPIDLMRWLVRLVTPPGGLVLDPFVGSGTTGIAAVLDGFRFVGIERESEYVALARKRIAHAERSSGPSAERAAVLDALVPPPPDGVQLGLLSLLGGEP